MSRCISMPIGRRRCCSRYHASHACYPSCSCYAGRDCVQLCYSSYFSSCRHPNLVAG